MKTNETRQYILEYNKASLESFYQDIGASCLLVERRYWPALRSTAHCFLPVFIIRALWMWGITPPPAIVALIRVSSSSSPLIASLRWRGAMRLTLRSLLALPASSRTSAVRYSRIAAVYTAEVAPTRELELTRDLRNL